jgi:hypothetical protein
VKEKDHLFGYSIQSVIFGWVYIGWLAINGICWTAYYIYNRLFKRDIKSFSSIWTEKMADVLGEKEVISE